MTFYCNYHKDYHIYFLICIVSATWPEGVRRLATSYMKNPMQVFVGSLDLAVSAHMQTRDIDPMLVLPLQRGDPAL